MILRRHKLEMPSFDVRACHHLGHANHYTNQQICIVLRAIGLLVWVLLNRVQSWRVTSRLIVCDGLWWFVEYRTIFSQSLEVVDTSRLIHRISLNLSLDVLNPAPQRILLPDSLSLSLPLSLSLWILRRPSFLLPPMRCWQSEIPWSPCAKKTSAGPVQKTRTILLEKLVLNKALWYLYLCKSFIKFI